MEELHVQVIKGRSDPRIAAIAPLFEEMHAEMSAQGLSLRLAPDGARLWLDGVMPGFERFSRLVVAQQGDVVIGFAHGAWKLAPEHLGGARIGHITHLYVRPAHRRSGIARRMLAPLEEWFREKEVGGIELQVVEGNGPGLAFWKNAGFAVELLQLRRP